MTGVLHRANDDRLLVVVPRSGIDKVLAEQAGRPVAALLTAHDVATDLRGIEQDIRSLLEHGCEYFVCVGVASEALHDRIDDLIVESTTAAARVVMTTWHSDETAAEVAEFFFNIAAAKERTLLVAALEEHDSELAGLLVQQALVLRG